MSSDGREASGGTTPSSTPISTTSCISTPDLVKAVLEELKKRDDNKTVYNVFNVSGSNNTINIGDNQVNNITQNNTQNILNNPNIWTQPLNVKEKPFLEAMVRPLYDITAEGKLLNLEMDGSIRAPSMENIANGTCLIVDERPPEGVFRGTGFLATLQVKRYEKEETKKKVYFYEFCGFFAAGHMLDHTGSDDRDFFNIHLLFNNIKGRVCAGNRRELGDDPVRIQLHDMMNLFPAIIVSCHRGQKITKDTRSKKKEWIEETCSQDLDFFAIIFLAKADHVGKLLQEERRGQKFGNPYFFQVSTNLRQEPQKPVIMFGFPSFDGGALRFMFGQEQDKEDVKQDIKEKIASFDDPAVDNPEKMALIKFRQGLEHSMVYNIETFEGMSGAPVLSSRYEVKGLHTRSSPHPYTVNEGTSFQIILEIVSNMI